MTIRYLSIFTPIYCWSLNLDSETLSLCCYKKPTDYFEFSRHVQKIYEYFCAQETNCKTNCLTIFMTGNNSDRKIFWERLFAFHSSEMKWWKPIHGGNICVILKWNSHTPEWQSPRLPWFILAVPPSRLNRYFLANCLVYEIPHYLNGQIAPISTKLQSFSLQYQTQMLSFNEVSELTHRQFQFSGQMNTNTLCFPYIPLICSEISECSRVKLIAITYLLIYWLLLSNV